ncbi:MAG: protein kinase [Candidatus Marinimicrobia bacterium]|nr:protein kinase [Candidatus Neomarinimicrobiota bacterium]
MLKIKGYQIQSVLEERNDLIIAKAIQTSLDRIVFLKILTKMADAPDIREQFTREAKLLARLNHANIVTIHEFNAHHEPPYLVLEYFSGEDMSRVLANQGTLKPEILGEVMRQSLAGCAKAHAAGILHRDLKPANLLMNQDGQVKITDFGLAAVLEQTRQPVAGSPGYLAPELALGEAPTPQSDIYALGMTFYTLATGENPLIGQNLNDTLNLAIKSNPKNLAEIRPDLPGELVKIIHRMIRKEAGDRYQDCETILEHLGDLAVVKPSSRNLQPELGPSAFRPRFGKNDPVKDLDLLDTPSRKDWLLGLAFFVLLVIAIYSWSNSKKPDSVVPYPVMVPETSRVDTGTMFQSRSPIPDDANDQETKTASYPEGEGVTTEAQETQAEDTSTNAPRIFSESKSSAPANESGLLFLAAIPWAQVHLDGETVGTTPFAEPITMTPGQHTVQFLHPDYPKLTKLVDIQAGKTDSVWLNWRTELGFLSINVFPWADIYVNSDSVDVTPIEKPLPLQPGEYQLLLKNPDFPPWHRFVQITAGDTLEITARLGQVSAP